MADKYKYRIKGNESFILREGWLRKCLRYVQDELEENSFRREDATELFGVGSNMVKALRYWSGATGLVIEETSGKRRHKKTDLGKLICKYDPYFDDLFSLWLIHYNLTTNEDTATLWYYFFNEFNAQTFRKETLFRELQRVLSSKTDDIPSEKSFWDDCTSVLKTYCSEFVVQNPEDNYICPLVELGLLRQIGLEEYEKTTPSVYKLDKMVVLYYLLKQIESRNSSSYGISLEDALYLKNSAGKLLNLNRHKLYEYCEQLSSANYLTMNRTAGLNMIYIDKLISSNEVVIKYFESKK